MTTTWYAPDGLVSSVRVTFSPLHAHVRVWNRGSYAGELTVLRRDWCGLVRLLGFEVDAVDDDGTVTTREVER